MKSSLLENEERLKYEQLWGEISAYRHTSPADLLTPIFLHYFASRLRGGDKVIDFGCGPGRSAIPLLQAKLRIELLDFAQNCLDPSILSLVFEHPQALSFRQACLWSLPSAMETAEWGICFDVLEHIPLQKVDEVLKGISTKVTKGALFAIELSEDTFGQTIGAKLHLSILPSATWIQKVSCYFQIEQVLLEDERKLLLALIPK